MPRSASRARIRMRISIRCNVMPRVDIGKVGTTDIDNSEQGDDIARVGNTADHQ